MSVDSRKRFSFSTDKKKAMTDSTLLSPPIESREVATVKPSLSSIRKLKFQSKNSINNYCSVDISPGHIPHPMEGNQGSVKRSWLWKWTNYIRGYQKRWFVLDSGTLSYYRSKEEISHSCRGTINLFGAYIETMNRSYFVVRNGTSQVFHLRASSDTEKQEWITALNTAKNHVSLSHGYECYTSLLNNRVRRLSEYQMKSLKKLLRFDIKSQKVNLS